MRRAREYSAIPMNHTITALLPLDGPWPAQGSAALRAAEAVELAAQPASSPSPLMEAAGLAAARLTRALAPRAQRVSLLCGPGNNGGDGLVAARWLHRQGLTVTAQLLGGASRTHEHAAALALARAHGVRVREGPGIDAEAELVIDALLGIGLKDAPRGDIAAALAELARHDALRLALDVPSGLDADQGRDFGAVSCQHTLTYLAAKPGLFTGAGRQRAGRIWLTDLGLDASRWPALPAAWLQGRGVLRDWLRESPRARLAQAGHKGHQGDFWVASGAMPGAAQLAARAGLLAGAGRVYLLGGGSDAQRPELMGADWPQWAAASSGTAVAGCGWGDSAGRLIQLIEEAERLVLDADGLNLVAAQPALRQALCGRARRGQSTVLTPHPLEAARLLGIGTGEVQAARLNAARDLAERFDCTVVLKGSGTVIASPDQVPSINTTGHAALAGPGTGDVLAGWLGGLWAQAPQADVHALAGIACAWHGLAVEDLPPGGAALPAADLVQRMHALHPHP